MLRVTILASNLGATATGTLAAALATHIPLGVSVSLVALERAPSTATAHLSARGVVPRVVRVRGPFDVAGWRDLRAALRATRPEVLHPIGRRARRLARLVHRGPVATFTSPVVLPTAASSVRLSDWGVPAGARVILAAGGFEAVSDLKTAVWAFEVLKFTGRDWHFVLCGDGPRRAEVARFAQRLGFDDVRIHFVGVRADVPALMRQATVVWVTHRRGGATTLLEAQQAGVPVVAVDTPELRVVGAGAKFVPPGDAVALATATFRGPLEPGAGVPAEFLPEAVAERATAVYHAVAAPLLARL